jgi:hypothetical protein
MSLPSSDDASLDVSVKPRADLYTVLLLVAVLALTIGTVFLYLEAADYGPTPSGEPTTSFYQPSPRNRSIDSGAICALAPITVRPAAVG